MRIKSVKTGCTIPIRDYKTPIVQKGRSPYIDETTNTWFVFNDAIQSYVDTGVKAKVIVDDTLSETSENPVQNKIITNEVNAKVNNDDMRILMPIDIDMLWENC